ncbi:MAG: hypothetical protein WBO97_16780, partial [Tepidiformaceae bacterium]
MAASADVTGVHARDWYWTACGLLAAVVLVVASFLPLWSLTLHAPQYPQGLNLTAYGTSLE